MFADAVRCTKMTVVPPYLIEALERHPSRRVRRAAEGTRATVIRHERLPVAPAERVARRPHPRRRLVYDSEGTRTLPGRLVRTEGERSCGDEDADRAYDMAGQTLQFYAAVFERDSIDDRGMHVVSSVHFGERYQNASWDGAQMIYGDGDGEVFNSFTSCLDVAAHEIAHGVVQADAGIVYEGESAALCESIADVFDSLVVGAAAERCRGRLGGRCGHLSAGDQRRGITVACRAGLGVRRSGARRSRSAAVAHARFRGVQSGEQERPCAHGYILARPPLFQFLLTCCEGLRRVCLRRIDRRSRPSCHANRRQEVTSKTGPRARL